MKEGSTLCLFRNEPGCPTLKKEQTAPYVFRCDDDSLFEPGTLQLNEMYSKISDHDTAIPK
jgi:hypothetical protein